MKKLPVLVIPCLAVMAGSNGNCGEDNPAVQFTCESVFGVSVEQGSVSNVVPNLCRGTREPDYWDTTQFDLRFGDLPAGLDLALTPTDPEAPSLRIAVKATTDIGLGEYTIPLSVALIGSNCTLPGSSELADCLSRVDLRVRVYAPGTMPKFDVTLEARVGGSLLGADGLVAEGAAITLTPRVAGAVGPLSYAWEAYDMITTGGRDLAVHGKTTAVVTTSTMPAHQRAFRLVVTDEGVEPQAHVTVDRLFEGRGFVRVGPLLEAIPTYPGTEFRPGIHLEETPTHWAIPSESTVRLETIGDHMTAAERDAFLASAIAQASAPWQTVRLQHEFRSDALPLGLTGVFRLVWDVGIDRVNYGPVGRAGYAVAFYRGY